MPRKMDATSRPTRTGATASADPRRYPVQVRTTFVRLARRSAA
jgi:hypothetical protein